MIEILQKYINDEYKIFEEYHFSFFKKDMSSCFEVWEYIESNKGKRIRPILSLLMSGINGKITQDSYLSASLVEVIHTCSLIQDDVLDRANMRRGSQTLNYMFGDRFSVFFSLYLITKFVDHCVEKNKKNILDKIYGTIQEMVNAEVSQAKRGLFRTVSESEYFNIINGKTAILFRTSLELGTRATTDDEDNVKRAGEIGYNIGMAFQISDDILDFMDETGKNKFNDVREGKITLPLIYALKKSSLIKRFFILLGIRIIPNSPKLHKEIEKILLDQNGIDYAELKVYEFIEKGRDLLNEFPSSKYRQCMYEITELLVQRKK